jgi:hypothetical protein
MKTTSRITWAFRILGWVSLALLALADPSLASTYVVLRAADDDDLD